MFERTDGLTDGWKDENNISLGINAGCLISPYRNTHNLPMSLSWDARLKDTIWIA